MILRLRLAGCDTHTGALNPEFRMIEAGQRLTKRLGHAVQGVRYDVDLVIKIFSWRVIPHRMNGTGIENPVAAVMARGLIKIVKALNIGIPDNAPRTFGCLSAKMQDAITSGHQTHDRLAIGKISLHHLFMYRRCTKIVPVTDANGFGQMRNMLAAMAAQRTCGTGNQQTLHRHGRSPVKKIPLSPGKACLRQAGYTKPRNGKQAPGMRLRRVIFKTFICRGNIQYIQPVTAKHRLGRVGDRHADRPVQLAIRGDPRNLPATNQRCPVTTV